jgi:hypothetical protein
MVYKEAKEYISKGRTPTKGRSVYGKVATELHYIDENETIGLKYHQTDVVKFFKNGIIELDTGGWHTMTTKARMNEYLPYGFYVSQKQGIWYVENNGNVYGFKDGVKIDVANNKILNAPTETEIDKVKKLRKQVNKYANDFINELFAENVPAPSNGDCWYCLMENKEGESLGELTESDHIQQHIKEKYYVPSLLVRAIENGGISIAAKSIVAHLWGQTEDYWEGFEDIAKEQLKRALKKYIRLQLGI